MNVLQYVLVIINKYFRYRVLEDGVGGYLLEVQSAEWPDEGEWKCVATSAGGRVGISTCYVSMDGKYYYVKENKLWIEYYLF